MKNIFFIIILFLLACSTEKGTVRKLYKAQAKTPLVVAGFCSELYPPIESVKDSIVVLPARLPEQVYSYIDCDTIIEKSKPVKVRCPMTLVRDTLIKYRQVQVVNKAEMQALELENNALVERNSVLRSHRKILIWFLVVATLYFCIKWILRKFF